MKLRSLTVTEANKMVKNYLESNPLLLSISVVGQVSGLKIHSSGHCYFNLKDHNSRIPCVMFKYAYEENGLELVEGNEIEARGKISVFEAGGLYQLYVNTFESSGQGKLHLMFEKLKEELSKKGYFERERKRKILFPKKIAIITSPTGAVISDILNISKRRSQMVDFLVIPSLVQGREAAQSIVEAINKANEMGHIDGILLARGGGSIEDLWCFNEEIVAHAIYNSKIPVISAVGHETDFTIADFVADMRASTPSAAAELLTGDYMGIEESLDFYMDRIDTVMDNGLNRLRSSLSAYSPGRFKHKMLSAISELQISTDFYRSLMDKTVDFKLSEYKHELDKMAVSLNQSSPLNVIAKGYSITMDKDNNIIKSCDSIEVGEDIRVKLKDGTLGCKVQGII